MLSFYQTPLKPKNQPYKQTPALQSPLQVLPLSTMPRLRLATARFLKRLLNQNHKRQLRLLHPTLLKSMAATFSFFQLTAIQCQPQIILPPISVITVVALISLFTGITLIPYLALSKIFPLEPALLLP